MKEQTTPIDRQLEAYEESWKQDHEAAMECWMLEDLVLTGLAVFNLLQRSEQAWRDRVFRGALEFDQETNEKCRQSWDGWLKVTRSILAKAAEMETIFGAIGGVSDLRRATAEISNALASWQPPRLAAAVGLREMTLSQNEADDLAGHIEDAKRTPPPMPVRRMETREASFLKPTS
jgi:hypothetical protein